nr:hypothetical protein CFP56_26742 [Quercus suber]
MGRFKKYVYTEEAMEKFIADYRIPGNVGLRYCEDGDWLLQRQEGEVVIPIVTFLEGGMRFPMGLVMRDYLTHFRLAPTQCGINVFRILGCVDTLNEKMGVRLIHCLPESSKGLNEDFLIVSGEWHDGLHCPTMEGIPDSHAFERHFHLVNLKDLQKVLRASVYINEDDNQVKAAHKILGYTLVQKSFLIPKHVIRANDPRLQKITVTEDGFQFPEEPSKPEVVTVAFPSSSQVFAEVADEAPERKEDAFDVFTQLDQSEDPPGDLGNPRLTEADLLASEALPLPMMGYKRKPTTSLLDLIEGQPGKSQQKLPPTPSKTRSTSAQQKLPPPPPPPSQTSLPSGSVPADPKKKKDKGKRLIEDKPVSSQEEDNTLWPSKQLKIGGKSQDRQVVDTSSEAQAWLPSPMPHGEPLRDDASLRDFNEDEGVHVVDALERCLLLPTDMAELNSLRSRQVFLSLKRYMGMAVQAVYRLEEAANDQGKALDQERNRRFQATQTLKNSEADLAKTREDLKAITSARDSAVSGLEGAQNQAKEQTRHLGEAEEQLGIARDLIADLQAKVTAPDGAQREADWAREEARRAKVEANFGREMARTAKEEAKTAIYTDGVVEVEALYKAQVPGVCRQYCSQVWAEALKQDGVEATSDLWKAENVYYPPAICKAAPDGAKAGEIVEEVGAAELRENPSEEVPQEVAAVPSDVQIPTTEEAAILAVPLQAVPLGQGSED